MGVAARLFFSDSKDRQTLHARITPSEEQNESQKERWNALADFLCPALRAKTGYTIRTWLQGSYKFRVQVRPVRQHDEFDIDMGVYFEWDATSDSGLQPINMKQIVQSVLYEYATIEEGIKKVEEPPKERCSRVVYDGSFHIDIPAYHLDLTSDKRRLATENHGWEDSDPKAIYIWFKEQAGDSDDASQIRRIVRYLKCWAALKIDNEQRPSSILLTVLATEAYRSLQLDAADDDVLLAVIQTIISRLLSNSVVPNPVDASENLSRLSNEAFNNFLAKLAEIEKIARAAVAAVQIIAAADEWSKIFEHFFPLPDPSALLSEASNRNRGLIPYFQPDIQVVAIPRKNKNIRYSGVNSITQIPKDCDIYFSIKNPNVLPPMSEVEWVVRNEGMEAENENDLGHVAERGLTTHERSAYNGRHYMDCLIKRLGSLVGFRRVPVEISDGMKVPLRNPPRPGFVKTRGLSR